jgi:ABC-2 type transport system permease protein
MDKIKTIISKEWAEVFQNRMVLFSVIFMPLTFAALPLFMLYAMRSSGAGSVDVGSVPQAFLSGCAEGLSTGECFQVYFVTQFMLLFMLTPLIVPVNIAAYSVAGEKTTRSLEPLLATPITTAELLAGKNLAAVIPAVLATWLSFLIFGVGARILIANARVLSALFNPMWWVAILVVGPLLSVLSTNFSLMVSSRVNDPRVAEQLSSVIMLPLLVLFFGQIAGYVSLNANLMILLALALLAVDALMVYLAIQLFQRETILTRWK